MAEISEQEKMDMETIGRLLEENKQQAERIKELEAHISECMMYRFSALGCRCGLYKKEHSDSTGMKSGE